MRARAKTRRKNLIANLPSGVGVTASKNGTGRQYWRVRLGKRFTGGNIVYKNFHNLDDARDWIATHQGQRSNTGAETYSLTAAQLAEASDAFKRLAGSGLSLTGAVTWALKRHRRPADTLSWDEAVARWLSSPRRRPLSERTIQAYTLSVQMLAREMTKSKLKLHEVSKPDLTGWLLDDVREWEAATVAHHLRNLRCFFAWLAKEKWIADDHRSNAASISAIILASQ